MQREACAGIAGEVAEALLEKNKAANEKSVGQQALGLAIQDKANARRDKIDMERAKGNSQVWLKPVRNGNRDWEKEDAQLAKDDLSTAKEDVEVTGTEDLKNGKEDIATAEENMRRAEEFKNKLEKP